jgi:hypothetical protein
MSARDHRPVQAQYVNYCSARYTEMPANIQAYDPSYLLICEKILIVIVLE